MVEGASVDELAEALLRAVDVGGEEDTCLNGGCLDRCWGRSIGREWGIQGPSDPSPPAQATYGQCAEVPSAKSGGELIVSRRPRPVQTPKQALRSGGWSPNSTGE